MIDKDLKEILTSLENILDQIDKHFDRIDKHFNEISETMDTIIVQGDSNLRFLNKLVELQSKLSKTNKTKIKILNPEYFKK